MARKRHKAATNKVSRLRSKGVELTGTKYDPRKPPANFSKMRSRDLQNYIKKLDGFVSRGTQFVGDREDRPIPAKQWKGYKQVEAKRNVKREVRTQLVKDVFIPESGLTAGERHELMDATKSQASNASVNIEWKALDRKSSSIRSAKSLAVLEKAIRKDLSPGAQNKKIADAKRTAQAIAKDMGDVELAERIRNLSKQNFWFLWNDTKFMRDLTLPYELHKKLYSKGQRATEGSSVDMNLKIAGRQVGWAKTLKLDSRL